jgi:hypothetical protein
MVTHVNPQIPPVNDQRKTDSDLLTLLAIFHYVGAALALVGILFLVVHYGIMRTVMTNPEVTKNIQTSGPTPAQMLGMFTWLYGVLGAVSLGYGVLNVLSAMSIQARRRRTLSMVVAGLNCIHIPLGTLLGVFTFVVLMRPSVQQLYAKKESGVLPETA